MTTTSERLLQIAEQYDQKAAALRLAANELHEERTQTATKKFGQRLHAAVATRAATRNGNGNNSADARETKQRRRALVQELMSDGATHTVANIAAQLEARQFHQGRNIIWQDLKDLGATADPTVKFGYRMSSNGNGQPDAVIVKKRDTHGDQTEGRRKVLLALLRKGPQQIKTLQKALNEAGYMIQRDRTRQFIIEHIPEAHCEGTAGRALWMLGAKPKGKTAKKRTPGYSVNLRAQRERSADLLAQFDTTTPKMPPAAMKPGAVGVYVRRGYLRKKDTGYIRTAKAFSVSLP